MPYGDANAIVMEMAAEVLTVVKETPVLAGVCGTDPFRQIPRFLKEVKEIGFAGISNASRFACRNLYFAARLCPASTRTSGLQAMTQTSYLPLTLTTLLDDPPFQDNLK